MIVILLLGRLDAARAPGLSAVRPAQLLGLDSG
jgi:hypothetical protein